MRQIWTLPNRGIFLVLASVTATVLLRWSLEPLLHDSAPLLAFVLPVTVCAALGGFRVGMVTTISSAVIGDYFFIAPVDTLAVSRNEDIVRLILFALVGFVISGMSGRMHREIDRTTEAERKVAAREGALRQLHAELERRTAELESFISHAPVGFALIDRDRRYIRVNEALSRMTGATPLDIVGRTVAEVVPKHLLVDIEHALHRCFELGEPSATMEVSAENPMHPGDQRHFLMTFFPVRDSKSILAAGGITLDITERKRTEESERVARAEAERASRLKDEFVATLSHELRTPLTAILGWAQILKRPTRDQDKLERGLDVIERNTRLLAQLVSDLLDVGRIVTGKLHLDTTPIDLGAVTRGAVETVRPVANAKGVKLITDVAAIGEPLLGDAWRIEQIVWNLVSNAIKFTPRDGTVEVRVEPRHEWATITVRDTGQGIAPEFLPHIFERFRQEDSSSSRKHGGLGLGLAIVKHLAELHGGRVRVESVGTGRGATFTVDLPLASYADRFAFGPSATSLPLAVGSGSTLGGVRVLVVEDEPDTREFVQRVLEESSAQVVCAGSAAEALEMLESARPDVLVSDIGMPGMDGYALVHAIHARTSADHKPPLPALALTAFARIEDRERALSAGYSEHMTKPIDPANLVRTVARLYRGTSGFEEKTRPG